MMDKVSQKVRDNLFNEMEEILGKERAKKLVLEALQAERERLFKNICGVETEIEQSDIRQKVLVRTVENMDCFISRGVQPSQIVWQRITSSQLLDNLTEFLCDTSGLTTWYYHEGG